MRRLVPTRWLWFGAGVLCAFAGVVVTDWAIDTFIDNDFGV